MSRIYKYAESLGLDSKTVPHLCNTYYKDYGLAIRGLIKHHQIDPFDYDIKVDQSIHLEKYIKPNAKLKQTLTKLKAKNCKIWAFTNANKTHALRVLKILEIYELFDGITYCNYNVKDFNCKPEIEAFNRALRDVNYDKAIHHKIYYVDDSVDNLLTAKICLVDEFHQYDQTVIQNVIDDVTKIEDVFPELF